MAPYNPSRLEARTHYAGFFDTGFGFSLDDILVKGTPATLETRLRDISSRLAHGQSIVQIIIERMRSAPLDEKGKPMLYGSRGSYQSQRGPTPSKVFKRPK